MFGLDRWLDFSQEHSHQTSALCRDKGEAKLKTEQTIVGWDHSRESSRAVFDAQPFLLKAELTRLVTVDDQGAGRLPAARNAEALDRHGVKTEVTAVAANGISVGKALLRAANDMGLTL